MKALIDPRFNRVCQVEPEEFEVAGVLFWVDCNDDVKPETHTWSESLGIVKVESPDDGSEQYKTILDQYPVANLSHIQSVINAFTGASMTLEVMQRGADPIGVVCTALRSEGSEVGATTLMRMRGFREMAQNFGIPVFSTPDNQETADQIVQFNIEVMGQMRLEHKGNSFMYSPWNMEIIKNRKRRMIEADRDQAIANGVSWNDYVWDCDEVSRSNLTGVVASFNAGVPLPDNFIWRTKDNQNVLISGEEAVQLGSAMLAHVNNAYQESWNRKADVDAATTEEQVNDA